MSKIGMQKSRTRRSRKSTTYFRPRRLAHVNLWVDDLAKSEAFYNDVCGLAVEFTEPDLIATFLGTGHTQHDLGMIQKTNGIDRYGKDGLLQLPGTVGLKAGLNHLAWELANEAELVEGYRRLMAAGIGTDLTVDHQIAHSVYMFDPEQNYNEFYCDTVRDWRAVLHGKMDLITSQWDPLKAEGFTDTRYDPNPVLSSHPTAPLKPWRITHAVLQVKDVPAMKRFYTEVAGLRIVSDSGDAIYLGGSHGDYAHNLVLVRGREPAYLHASFQLEGEERLNAAIDALKNGKSSIEKIVDLPWKRSVFLRDPDGLASEWYVARKDARDLAKRGKVSLAYAV